MYIYIIYIVIAILIIIVCAKVYVGLYGVTIVTDIDRLVAVSISSYSTLLYHNYYVYTLF